MNNLIRNSEGLGSQKGLAFQKVGSLLYKDCRGVLVGVSQKGHRVSSFPSLILLSVIDGTHLINLLEWWQCAFVDHSTTVLS